MMLDGQRIDPVAFSRYMQDRVAGSRLNGLVPSWGPRFGITTGSPQEWARFWTMVQQQESGHRIAPVNADGSLQRFGTTRPTENSFGPGQFNVGEYGLKTWADVNDPAKVADAYIRVAEADKVPAYFGSVQRPHETLQHGKWYDESIAPKLSRQPSYGEDAWLDPGTPQQNTLAPSEPRAPSGNRLMAAASPQTPQPNALMSIGDMLMGMGKRPQQSAMRLPSYAPHNVNLWKPGAV